ncbi:MAG: C-terminal binding protein [Alphaproteobacteria bacterium]|nr:C-terminal binding protein [Alphaproteobacteria bacterium]
MNERLVITQTSFTDFSAEQEAANAHGLQIVHAGEHPGLDLVSLCTRARVVMVQFAEITGEVIAALAPRALIVRYGIGLDNIDLAAARARDIRVAYVPDYATGEVADHSAALALAVLRKLPSLDRSVRAGQWRPVEICNPMPSFSRSTLGLLGFGRIAREMGRRMKGFGFEVIAHDPWVDAEAFSAQGARAVSLDTLFEHADCLSLHAPLVPDTHHVVNARTLSLMKPTAVLVNASRGALVDPAALASALSAGTIAGAGLDVFEHEPLAHDSPLRAAPNLLLTPHTAWYSDAATRRVQELAANEISFFATGQPARCPAPFPEAAG